MMATAPASLAADLATWPGIVLRVSRDDVVLASNGRLDALLGTDVVGRPVAELLDADSSSGKWRRRGATSQPLELVFASAERMLETGAFSLLPAGGGDELLLVEHPALARLGQLNAEMAAVNTDLSVAQRSLVIERARLERALLEVERSNRALDEFAHVVSHDLKAPLRGIRDYAELLVDPSMESTDDERATYLRRIADLSLRMRRMIDAALEYARAGREANRVERVDTGELLHDIVAFLAPPPDVAIHVAAGMPVIETERVPLEQVLRNLLSNAINYRRPGHARIEVSATDAGDNWELVVQDNGPGIPASQQERIWRLFHTSRPGEGTGLGLALVKRIVESQQGTVHVVSEVGRGTSFHVRWPKRPRAAAPRGGGGGE